ERSPQRERARDQERDARHRPRREPGRDPDPRPGDLAAPRRDLPDRRDVLHPRPRLAQRDVRQPGADLRGAAPRRRRDHERLDDGAVNADHGYIFIKHPEKGELTIGGSYEKGQGGDVDEGSADETTPPVLPKEGPMISRTIVKRVLRFGRAIMSSDASMDDRF